MACLLDMGVTRTPPSLLCLQGERAPLDSVHSRIGGDMKPQPPTNTPRERFGHPARFQREVAQEAGILTDNRGKLPIGTFVRPSSRRLDKVTAHSGVIWKCADETSAL